MRKLALVLAVVVLGACKVRTATVVPVLQPPAESYDFGAVPVLNEKTLDVPCKNVGSADLSVTNVKLTGDAAFTLKKVPDALTMIQSENTENITIAFTPPEEKDYTATLTFDSDDTDHPSTTVTFTGKGSTRAVMAVSPTSIDFGRVAECTSAVQTFTITSSGTADLQLTDLSFVDGGSPVFSKVGSWSTPATVPFKDKNGLNGAITLTVKMTVPEGTHDAQMGAIHIGSTDPDHQDFVIPLTGTVNQAPIANIAMLGNMSPGQTVALDGTASMDPDGDAPLTYKWTLASEPISATTTIMPTDMSTASMTLDPLVPGAYDVQLDVTDSAGAKNCVPAKQTVVGVPADKLLVEMFWDNAITDIDLHVLRTTHATVDRAPDDCYYANPNPDWGVAGDMSDDPVLERDALTGYGPELFGYKEPIDSTFRVLAEFANEHLSTTPNSNVTIRVYVFGVVKYEQTKLMTAAGQRWAAVDIAWPMGTVTPVP